jgi:uncharacterized protein with PIN domain
VIAVSFCLHGRLPSLTGPAALSRHVIGLKEPTSLKDALESLGIPHTEIDLILVAGEPVGFGYRVRDGDHVEVHDLPGAAEDEAGRISWCGSRLQPRPLAHTQFICDAHLGRLARLLRLLGFDTAYRRDWTETALAATAARENRAILTCSRGLLMRKDVVRGRLIASQAIEEQAREVIGRFGLASRVHPFTRCSLCNGETHAVPKAEVLARIPLRTRAWCDAYSRCATCGQLYWEGTHVERLRERYERIVGVAGEDA